KFARDSLVNGSGIEEAIGDDDRALVERRLDRFAHKLGAARFEKQHFGLRCHAETFRSELEEVTDFFADRRAAGLAGDERAHSSLLEPRGEPLDLRRFPAAFRTFECDERAASHLSECETKPRSCRIADAVLLIVP